MLTKCFSIEEQERFARLSGDWNPMHMDPLSARRTQAGALVVHGIHNLLWALDALAVCGQLSSSVKALRVRFSKLVYVGDVAEVDVQKVDDRELSARVMVGVASVLSVGVGVGRWDGTVE